MAATYTVKQVADILGYSTNSIYTFLKEKRIKGVRLGKGRFRIPQGELDRLLAVAPAKQPNAQDSATIAAPTVHAYEIAPETHIYMPHFFDWYVGALAMICAATLWLFLSLTESMDVAQYLVFIPLIQIACFAGAIGLLYGDIIQTKVNFWRGSFYVVILLAFIGIGGLSYVRTNYATVTLAILLVGAAAVRFSHKLRDIDVFMVYIGGMLFSIPIMLYFFPKTMPIGSFLYEQQGAYVGVIVASALYACFFSWISLRRALMGVRHSPALLVATGILFLVGSGWYGANASWLRAFFFLTTGFFVFFAVVWEMLSLSRNDHKRIVYMMVALLVGACLVSISLMRLLQENILNYAYANTVQKANLAALTVANRVATVKHALEVFAQNPQVFTGIKKEDTSLLQQVSRSLFESQFGLRRMVIIDAVGDVQSFYPLVGPAPATQNLGQRDYVIQAIATQKTIVSDVVMSQTAPSRPSIAIAVPVLGPGKVIVGVVIGVLDIDALSQELQKFVSGDRGEYVEIVDHSKKRILFPDTEFVGKEVRPEDSILLALAGQTGVGEDYARDELIAISAYTPVVNPQWGLAVKVPKRNIFTNIRVSLVTVIALSSIWIGMLFWIMVHHNKYKKGLLLPERVDSS